jgi:hypothetical protein
MSGLPSLLVALSAYGPPAMYHLATSSEDRDASECRLCQAVLRAHEQAEETCDSCLREHQWAA